MNFVELPGLLRKLHSRSFYRFLKESSWVEKLTMQYWRLALQFAFVVKPCWAGTVIASLFTLSRRPTARRLSTLCSRTKRGKTQMTSAKSQPYSNWLVPPLITFVYLP
jgi:hypothetical protein